MTTGRARVTSLFSQGTRNVQGLPTSKTGVVAITERGRVGERVVCTSAEDYAREFGGITANTTIAQFVDQFFQLAPGAELQVTRTMHYTDITDPTTYTGVQAALMLQNAGATATAGTTTGTNAATFSMTTGDDLDFDVDGAPAGTATFTGTPATDTDTAVYPIGALVAQTMGVKINGGAEQTVTAAGGETTAADVALMLNGQLTGCSVTVTGGGQVIITTDQAGTGAEIEISTPGTLNAILGFPVGPVSGGGNVADISAVTVAEVETVVEGAIATLDVTNDGSDHVVVTRTVTGSTKSFQCTGGTARTTIGLDTALHAGTDASPVNTLNVQGKTPGTYAHSLYITIAAASNGSADYFNLSVVKDSIVQELWKNVTMDTTATRYVETVINHTQTGSDLIVVTDQLTGLAASAAKPATGTTGPLAGGNDGLAAIADTDFVGSSTGKTGLYSFDTEANLRLVGIPSRASATVHAGLNTYVDYRERSLYAVHPTPDGATIATADMMVTYATSNTYGTTEFAAPPAWPRVGIANPNTTIYTSSHADVDTEDPGILYVDPSLFKMAKFARNDKLHPDGVFTSAAGIDNDQGVLPNVLALEFFDEVMDDGKRDRLADVNVEPIVKFEGTGYHFDGGDNCKTTGDWPRQWHTRGAIHLVESIKQSWLAYKHVKNTPPMRREAARNAEKFIRLEAPDEAFQVSDGTIAGIPSGQLLYYVDTSDALNPLAVQEAGEFRARIGLGFSYDAKFIEIEVTRPAAA